ncbi:MAG: ribonuclease HI [Clostridiales bacterium]|nr:ribonuclease HI [Clostridiales bacterium]
MAELSNTAKQLIVELEKIRDDEDFILGVMSNAKSEDARGKLLDYIHMAKRMGDCVTSDDMAILSLTIGQENE